MSTQTERELARDRLAKELSDAMDCTRVWDAWHYGTMSQDDFSLIAENDERLNDIVEAVCAHLLSRIAELEQERIKDRELIGQLDDRVGEQMKRIDALSKDAEPVAWISTVQCIGPDYGKELYGKLPVQSLQAGYYKHTPLYLGKQSSIDAAISAREGE